MRMLPGCPKDLWRVDGVTWCEVGSRRGTFAARAHASRRGRSYDRSPRAALVACGSGLDPLEMKRPLACSGLSIQVLAAGDLAFLALPQKQPGPRKVRWTL